MTKKTIKISESQLQRIIKESVETVLSEKKTDNFPKLNELYENTFNNSKPIPLSETNAKRLVDRHSKSGYAIISACRGGADFGLKPNNQQEKEKLATINKERTRELLNLIKKTGFSYTPSYGGFIENEGTPDAEEVFERSFIVYAEKKDGSVDMQGLKKFAIDMCKKFNQDSVLVKEPDQAPRYYDKTSKVDMEFSDDAAFNDVSQTYFTDLHKNTGTKIGKNGSPTRFSFIESYIAPTPQCFSERHLRHLKGEIFVD